ncbi:MAG: hypothetical protein NTY77_03925 [Elusimicrobia bacterium]|nr:hypothetical protein [Elusimicrobiota bacterium]
MARRTAETALWLLLSAAGPALAADEFTAPDLSGIRQGADQLKQSQQGQAQTARTAQLAQEQAYRRALSSLLEADLAPSDLRDHGWQDRDLPALAEAVRLASLAVQKLHAQHPSAVADAYGSGTMTNIEDSFKLFAGGNLERGCISHQSETIAALAGLRSALEVKKLMIGKGMEHHAVIVYPKGADWKRAGMVLDGWPNQSAVPKKMTFTIGQWQSKFFALRYLMLNPIVFQTGPRLED